MLITASDVSKMRLAATTGGGTVIARPSYRPPPLPGPGPQPARLARQTAQEHKVIRALHTAFMAMMRQFDADLQREHQLSHTEYVALDWFYGAPDRTLGLSDLAARCQQSLSATAAPSGAWNPRAWCAPEQSTRDARLQRRAHRRRG
jgi:hypothetical protein